MTNKVTKTVYGWVQRGASGKWFRIYSTRREALVWSGFGDAPLVRIRVKLPPRIKRKKGAR